MELSFWIRSKPIITSATWLHAVTDWMPTRKEKNSKKGEEGYNNQVVEKVCFRFNAKMLKRAGEEGSLLYSTKQDQLGI